MSKKQEQYSEHNSPYLALNAVAQYIQTTAGILDTCSHSQKVEILEAMARVTAAVTEVLVENLERERLTTSKNNESNYDNGELPSAIRCHHNYFKTQLQGICDKCQRNKTL